MYLLVAVRVAYLLIKSTVKFFTLDPSDPVLTATHLVEIWQDTPCTTFFSPYGAVF